MLPFRIQAGITYAEKLEVYEMFRSVITLLLIFAVTTTGFCMEYPADVQAKLNAIDRDVANFLGANPEVKIVNSRIAAMHARGKMLPARMTAEEQRLAEKLRTGKVIRSERTRSLTVPGEFEKAEAMFLGWPYNDFAVLQSQLASFVSQDYKVIICTPSNNKSTVEWYLKKAGAKMTNIKFLHFRLDAIWMRDYGPWFANEGSSRVILDMEYYPNRPNDNAFNRRMGATYDFPVYQTGYETEGGNMIFDGNGVAIIADGLFNGNGAYNPWYTKNQVIRIMTEHFDCKKVIIVKCLREAGGTGHIDLFAKLLDRKTFIVGYHSSPNAGYPGNYQILEDNAQILDNETNGWGEDFKVVRIPTPDHRKSTYSYTNSLTMNNKVLVPIFDICRKTGDRSFNDGLNEKALDVYRQVLPDHDVRGFDCEEIIHLGGAIHCITKLLMADSMKIADVQVDTNRNEAVVNVMVESIMPVQSVKLHWSTQEKGIYLEKELQFVDGKYTCTMPKQSGTVYYFVSATDQVDTYVTAPASAPDQINTITF